MRHVIVVEDDPLNALLFHKLLERRGGYRVTLTESPEEVLRLAREGADLVLLDVSLTDSFWEGRHVGGVDICRLLKSDPACAKIPAVLATAHAMRGDEERLLSESGADGYVAKPLVDHEAFLTLIRGLLRAEAA
ncbi:MAG: response regulator [Candidatus Eisenbacteria bacterium]|uniref:Response regulator n=1 Tax=Eiseniibacteriota bacterium TaxID=2212470 RepID=A0A538TX99_UNCEI|nr:MAG: response regulator [Candidatus Eisenbacteria bacterium]